jgi:Flp pilus assembly protein TadD
MDGAVESFLRAIEYEQSLAEAYFNLAITFFISGNRKNADRYFARAAAQNSKYADLQPKQTLSDHVYLTAVSAPGGPVGPNGNPMS